MITKCSVVFPFISHFAIFGTNMCSAEIVLDDALAIIKAMESQIQVLEWSVKNTSWTLAASDDSASGTLDASRGSTTGSVRWDPIGKRYHVTVDCIWPWQKGLDHNIAKHQELSFDGREYRVWERSQPGVDLPKPSDVVASGALSQVANDAGGNTFYNALIHAVGVNMLPPGFSPQLGDDTIMTLSRFIERQIEANHHVSISTTSNSLWNIDTNWYDAGGDFGSRAVVTYDSHKGCVTRTSLRNGTPETEWRRFEFDLSEAAPGIWIPNECRIIDTLGKPSMVKLEFSNIRINPKVTDESFVVSFPSGANVQDYTKGISYTVSTTPTDEAADVKKFLSDRGLIDDNPQTRPSQSVVYLLVINGIIALVIGAVFLIRWRRSSTAADSNRSHPNEQ